MKITIAVFMLLSIFGGKPKTAEPMFNQGPKGWEPQCPQKMTFVHQTDKKVPICQWTKPMQYKPTLGEFICIESKKVSKLPLCTEQEKYH